MKFDKNYLGHQFDKKIDFSYTLDQSQYYQCSKCNCYVSFRYEKRYSKYYLFMKSLLDPIKVYMLDMDCNSFIIKSLLE